jgi:hypothetical protein
LSSGVRIGGGTLERSFGKAVTGARGVLCERHFLSRVFLNYFYFRSPRFAVLRPVFACPLGQFWFRVSTFPRTLV